MGKRIASFAAVLILIAMPAIALAGYATSLRYATKTGRVYHTVTWDLKLIWRATFSSDSFREAFIKRHAVVNHLTPEETAVFTAEQERRQQDGWEFFIGMYTKDPYKNFSAYEDSFWQILLETESGEVYKPLSVDMIPITPYEGVMYPYLDRWSRAYRVVFPKVPLGSKIRLMLQSVIGQSTLKWNIE
ncbi:MAG: hypothetical protein WC956_07475 [bacterium]